MLLTNMAFYNVRANSKNFIPVETIYTKTNDIPTPPPHEHGVKFHFVQKASLQVMHFTLSPYTRTTHLETMNFTILLDG